MNRLLLVLSLLAFTTSGSLGVLYWESLETRRDLTARNSLSMPSTPPPGNSPLRFRTGRHARRANSVRPKPALRSPRRARANSRLTSSRRRPPSPRGNRSSARCAKHSVPCSAISPTPRPTPFLRNHRRLQKHHRRTRAPAGDVQRRSRAADGGRRVDGGIRKPRRTFFRGRGQRRS